MKSKLLSVLFSTFCLLAAVAGRAEAVLINQVGLSSGMNTSLYLPESTTAKNYFSGLQQIKIDNDEILLAFCIDPYQVAPSSNTTYQVSTDFDGYFGADAANVAKLYSLFYSSTLGNNLYAAGFQLALWELIADSSVDLTGDSVRTTGSTNASIKSMAQSMLDALAGNAGTDSYSYTIYTSSSKQDYLVVTLNRNQVPEPQAIALMALALGLLTVVARRRG